MTPNPAARLEPPHRADGYAPEEVIVATFPFSRAELREMAEGDPVIIRSVTIDGETFYDWPDVLLVSLITTAVTHGDEGDILL